MRKPIAVLIASAFLLGGISAHAADEKKPMAMDVKKMDSNSDGMISKDEYMKYQEAKFDSMKDKNGMISVKDMQKMMDDLYRR